jgi:hypothetical protein
VTRRALKGALPCSFGRLQLQCVRGARRQPLSSPHALLRHELVGPWAKGARGAAREGVPTGGNRRAAATQLALVLRAAHVKIKGAKNMRITNEALVFSRRL